jgi:hypothetical protein
MRSTQHAGNFIASAKKHQAENRAHQEYQEARQELFAGVLDNSLKWRASERVISTVAAEKIDDHPELQLWHAPEVYWPVAERTVRVVKTMRQQSVKQVRVQRDEHGEKRAAKETVLKPSTNFYASNLELGSVPPLFIHQLGRSRWIIDTTVFQTMATDAHLKRPSVHQDRANALIVLTMIRVLAYTLTLVFFFRQVRSHFRNCPLGFCDLAERLADWFIVLQVNSS